MKTVKARYDRTEYMHKYLIQQGVIEAVESNEITREGALSLAVAILICDDKGMFDESELVAALCDPSIVNAANQVLKKVGI